MWENKGGFTTYTVVHFNKSLTEAGATFFYWVQQACGGSFTFGYKIRL